MPAARLAQTLLAHGVQVDADDLALLHETRTCVAHCPRSNTRLLNGRLPWAAYRAAGVRLALGTDSLASAPSLSIWEEAAYAADLHTRAGEAPTPADLLRLATLDGANALGLADDLGALKPTKLARFAAAPLGRSSRQPRHPRRCMAAMMAGRRRSRRPAVRTFGRSTGRLGSAWYDSKYEDWAPTIQQDTPMRTDKEA